MRLCDIIRVRRSTQVWWRYFWLLRPSKILVVLVWRYQKDIAKLIYLKETSEDSECIQTDSKWPRGSLKIISYNKKQYRNRIWNSKFRESYVMNKNPSIYNILRWDPWMMEQMNRWPRVWYSKYYFFILFIDLGHSKLIFIFRIY